MMVRNDIIKLPILLWFVALSQASLNQEEAYVIGLFPEPVYDMANSTGSLANEQTITMVIKNRDSTANDIGLHAYLPEDAELTSFSMNTEGVQYNGKKVDQEKAHDILARAKSEDHSAVVYTPRVIPAVRRDNVVQAESTNLHIKAQKKMTFSINYKQTVADKIIYGKKMLNQASVVLDMYGGTAEKLVGTIFSPNYPQAYPNSADISWWVRVPQGKNVMLNILELDMEECCDRLTIYDGLSTNGKVLAVLSGILQNNESTVIQTSSPSMFLHLTSDCSYSFSGFAAQVSVVSNNTSPTHSPPTTTVNSVTDQTTSNITSCGGGEFVYGYSGYISSPNYPSNYYNNLHCSWQVQIPYNYYVVKLEALAFSLEANYDYLNIYDGPSTNYVRLARWTGSSYKGSVIYSTSYYMFLQLFTDSIVSDTGFRFYYSYSFPQTQTSAPPYNDDTTASSNTTLVACNGGDYLYDYSGIINSPNYPNYYDNNLRCSWQIRLPSYSYVVQLTIEDLHLQYGDYLNIYNGYSQYYPLIATLYGVDHSRPKYYSTSRDMFLLFTTDSNGGDMGFRVSYTYSYPQQTTSVPDNNDMTTQSSNIVACNGGEYLYSYYGTFSSPNYPNYYDNNLRCSWQIRLPSHSYVVQLTVEELHLQYSGDNLTLYDGYTQYYPMIVSLNGHDHSKPTYYSTSRDMFLLFTTDSYGGDMGFSVSYTYSYPQQTTAVPDNNEMTTQSSNIVACNGGEYLYSYYGNFSSPNYPNYYDNNLRCSWQIRLPSYSYVVQLTVEELHLQYSGDNLTLYDGYTQYYPMIVSLNGHDHSKPTYYSTSRDMFLLFTTDTYGGDMGFRVSYTYSYPQQTTAVPDNNEMTNQSSNIVACNGGDYVYDYSGIINSPNYPNNYYDNLECTWQIRIPYYNYIVRLTVLEFYTESCCDVLSVYNGPYDTYQLLVEWRGNIYSGQQVKSTSYSMFLKFTTDGSVTSNGFRLNFDSAYPDAIDGITEESATTHY